MSSAPNNLSNREQRIFEYLKKSRTATLDQIIEGIREERRLRNSVNASVRLLSFKLQGTDWQLSRTTGLGRGAKAVYHLEKVSKQEAEPTGISSL